MKPILEPVALCHLHITSFKEKASILFVATLLVKEDSDEIPYETFLLQSENTSPLQFFLIKHFLQMFDHFMASLGDEIEYLCYHLFCLITRKSS